VLVFLGRGDGTFEEELSFEAGRFDIDVQSLLVSDFDRDGKVDLAVAGLCGGFFESSCFISILLGRGDGTFDAPLSYDTGADIDFPSGPVTSDFNGDGNPDLAMGTAGGVLVALGRGDGTFEEAARHDLGVNVRVDVFVSSDFGGSEEPDLVLGTSGGVFVLLNLGDGTFEQLGRYEAANVLSLRASDLDGDGMLDLVARFFGKVVVLLNRGDGIFDESPSYNWEGELEISDLDGDRRPDLFGAHWASRMSVLMNRGDGTFEDAVSHETGGGPHNVSTLLASDLNNDSKTDVLASTWGGGGVVLLNQGDATFERSSLPEHAGSHYFRLLATDFDGDGRTDLAAVSTGGIWALRNRTRAPTSLDRDGDGIPDECQGPLFIRGDCNDDGEVDISDAVFSLGALFLGDGDPDCEDACDANDDGTVDISDAIATLGALFLGNGTIPPPGVNECGVDPTDDEIGCTTFGECP
jgi:hypothetical protein